MSAWSIVWRAAAAIVCLAAVGIAVLVLAHRRAWIEPPAPAGAPTTRLINAEQYIGIVHDLFGEDIEVQVTSAPLQRLQGLRSLSAASAVVTPGALEQFERAARQVAAQVVDQEHRQLLVPCAPAAADRADDRSDGACAEAFLARVGRRLHRRPLSEEDLRSYVAQANEVAARLKDFHTGLAYSLAGLLTSPEFLYFIEMTEPDPDRPGQVRLDGYSKALRLSLFLWNAPPDEELLLAAESGELHTAAGVKRHTRRLLASARLEQGVRAFFTDVLAFEKFDTLAKDPLIYPAFTGLVARSAKEQTLRLIADHLLRQGGDYRELFTTPRSFVNDTLGALYDERVPNAQGWMPIELDREHSAGLLTSLSFLTLHSHPGRSSPTLRGKAFRELLLCQKVPDPPPNVNFDLFEDPEQRFKTTRERLDAHSSDPVCAGCHKLTDPMGLALENFDGAGQFRTAENAASIDVSGTLDGLPFENVAGLGQALHDHPALGPCLASRLYAYGVGREVQAADRRWLSYIAKRFAVHEYRLTDLLREIAASRAFFAVSEPDAGEQGDPPASLTAANLQQDPA